MMSIPPRLGNRTTNEPAKNPRIVTNDLRVVELGDVQR